MENPIDEIEKKMGIGDKKLRDHENALELLKKAAKILESYHDRDRDDPEHTPWGKSDSAARFPGDGGPLDTNVELQITPFAITWKDKEKLTKELAALIAKYQI